MTQKHIFSANSCKRLYYDPGLEFVLTAPLHKIVRQTITTAVTCEVTYKTVSRDAEVNQKALGAFIHSGYTLWPVCWREKAGVSIDERAV